MDPRGEVGPGWPRAWFAQVWGEQPGLHRGYVVDVVTAALIGVVLVVGGRDRTQAPAWDTLNASGGPLMWGVVLLVLGALLVTATFWRTTAVVSVLVMLTAYYWLVAWWFLISALPAATGSSFVGAILTARAGVMHLSRAWAYWQRADQVEGAG